MSAPAASLIASGLASGVEDATFGAAAMLATTAATDKLGIPLDVDILRSSSPVGTLHAIGIPERSGAPRLEGRLGSADAGESDGGLWSAFLEVHSRIDYRAGRVPRLHGFALSIETIPIPAAAPS
jgi:hypothetical protein